MREWKGYVRGIDVGGWLSQCPHTVDRYENFVSKEDFVKIKSWGLDHVRVPVDYDLVEEKDGSIKESGYVYIDRAIRWCEETGLNMILDLHKTFGYSFDEGEAESGFFDNEKLQERFYRLWENFAKRYGHIGDRLAFELLNEVTDKAYCERWNKIAGNCIKRIRAIAPDVKILVGGYWNNSIEAVMDIDVPFDENIVLNFHCYEPLIFTHQKAGWVKEIPAGESYSLNHTFGEVAKRSGEIFANNEEKFIVAANGDLDKKFNYEFFAEFFKNAAERAEKLNLPLYCGEYGVIDFADPQETLEWFKMINKAFEKYGIGRAAWTYRSMDFGLDDDWVASVRDEIIKYL